MLALPAAARVLYPTSSPVGLGCSTAAAAAKARRVAAELALSGLSRRPGAGGLLLSTKRPLTRSLHLHVTPRRLSVAAAMAPVQRVEPKPGQESVWDYPRPPRMERVDKRIRIIFNGETIADTTEAFRILETSHPPVYYLPPKDIQMKCVTKAAGSSFCEWKGNATYWTVKVGDKSAPKVGWSYESITSSYKPMQGYIAFYASPMDACYVGDEKAQPQPGGFYGGWVTSDIVGPVKGAPGSWGW